MPPGGREYPAGSAGNRTREPLTVPLTGATMPIMSPIERAARALCAFEGNPEDAGHGGNPMWQGYVPRVAAVIAALHEPSEPMKEAGGEIFHGYNPEHSEFAHQSDAANVWRMMIDAMRKEV
jgi:hypothetical protein